nr:hypothetical protein BaRGS_029643 [Batillaria attramentaria]
MMLKIAVVLLVLALVSGSEARRGEGRRRVVVMKVKKLRGCVLLNKPTDLTKAGVTADLEALNGTTVAASTPVTMYLSNDALQPAQATDMQARTAVRAMCGRKPIRPATDVMPRD